MPSYVSRYISGILTFNFIQKWSQECKWHFSRIFWYFEWFLKVQFLFKTSWTWYRTENLKLTSPNKSFFCWCMSYQPTAKVSFSVMVFVVLFLLSSTKDFHFIPTSVCIWICKQEHDVSLSWFTPKPNVRIFLWLI